MHPTLLIVDRNQSIREFCREHLQHEGYNVLTAGDGYSALELAAAMRPAAVVLDPFLRRLESRDVLAALRRIVPTAPIIMFSVSPDADSDHAWESHADARVSKTEHFQTLIDTLRNLLAPIGHRNSDS